VSKYRYELDGRVLGDNLMIGSSLKRAEKASKIPRMKREYSKTYYTTCYSRYWGILISLAMKKASTVTYFKTTFPKSHHGLANLLEKQEEGKIKTDSYSRLSLEAQRTSEVLERLSQFNLKCNHTKCSFVEQEVRFLGFLINGNGIRNLYERTKAISEMVPPKSVTEVRSFLGEINHLRTFLGPHLSEIAG